MVTPDHPDLPYKPPLAYLLAILVGVLLHRWWPLPSRPEALLPVGVTSVAIAAATLIWAQVSFRAKRTPLEPWKATRAIVDSGPFAYSRNPVYLAFALTQVGIGLWADRLWIVALVALPVLATATVVVPREERYLRRKFGAEYEDYCARVRRWL